MAVGWIDNIYNNSQQIWYMKSVDDRHNGRLTAGSESFKLDDGAFHPLSPGIHYTADSCGIPWYYQGKHFKVISRNTTGGVRFYTSEIGDKNWIIYEEDGRGRELARQTVPKGSNFHCNLRFEDSGVFIDIVNNPEFSAENAVFQVLRETRDLVVALAPDVAQIIGIAAA